MSKKLKVPTLQHMARMWRDDPVKVKNKLIGLLNSSPPVSYQKLFPLVHDLLLFDVPSTQLIRSIEEFEKREKYRDDFIELINLTEKHFSGICPDFVIPIASRSYPIGRGLRIPFTPQLLYGINSELYMPWFSFWKNNPLSDIQLQLFVTIIDELFSNDPDLESSNFYILDFSIDDKESPRSLKVIDTNKIPRLSDTQKSEMLDIFAKGLLLANDELAKSAESSVMGKVVDIAENINQLNLNFYK